MRIKENHINTRSFTLTDKAATVSKTTISLDLDNYSLSVEHEREVFGCTWTPTPKTESFLSLICNLKKEDLLKKVDYKRIFDLGKSIESTLAELKSEGYKISEDTTEKIKSINAWSQEAFRSRCKTILWEAKEHSSLTEPYVHDCIICEKEYPKSKIRFVDMFCDEFQPYLRKLLKTETKTGAITTYSAIDPVHAAGACYCRECQFEISTKTIRESTGALWCSYKLQPCRGDEFCSNGVMQHGKK